MQMEEMRAELRQMGLLHEKATAASNEALLVHLLRTVVVADRMRHQREQEIIDLLTVRDLPFLTTNSNVTRILGEGAWSGTE